MTTYTFGRDKQRLVPFILSELKPRGPIVTPFNVITGLIMAVGAALVLQRFTHGIGAITNHTQSHPWGLWVGFNVITGVAFAGGAYIITFMVYVLRLDKYHPIVRVTVLNGFLAYAFYAGALFLDLGRPWNVINPIIGNSFGLGSVLFLVAWHFLLYMIAELIEFSPTIAEWLGSTKLKRIVSSLTLGSVIFGITLSTLHQSGLGALFLMAKGKIHPLWYSEFIPILFLVSSVFAGLSLVILEGSISRKVFAHRASSEYLESHRNIVFGLARVCAVAMFVYLALKGLVFIHGKHWVHLGDNMGRWFLVEVIGFTLVPCVLYVIGLRRRSINLLRVAAVVAMLGIVLNRLNTSTFTYRWYDAHGYSFSWMETMVILAIISAQIWVFRWVINRMPVIGPVQQSAADDQKQQQAQQA